MQGSDDLQACHASHGQLRSMLGVVGDLESYAALDSFESGPGFPLICTIWGIENKTLFKDALPVDPRHNSKIERPALAKWAATRVKGRAESPLRRGAAQEARA